MLVWGGVLPTVNTHHFLVSASYACWSQEKLLVQLWGNTSRSVRSLTLRREDLSLDSDLGCLPYKLIILME